MTHISLHPKGIILKITVQPRSSKNMITGVHDDALKIKLMAPPVEGAANKMCIQYLSKKLGIPKSSLDMIKGHKGRKKQVFILCSTDKEKEMIRQRIEVISK